MYNYLRGAFLGIIPITSDVPFLPDPSAYDRVTFYGGQYGQVIDKVYGRNVTMTPQIIQENSYLAWRPKWTQDTYLLAEFEHNLSGGNISNLTSPILEWQIFREEGNSGILKRLDNADVYATHYYDYTALKNKTYTYYLFAANDTEMSAPLVSNPVDVYYHGWYLIDVENEVIYLFDLNLTGADVSYAENIAEYNTNKKYNAYSRGATEFAEGSIQAFVPEDLCTMEQSVDFINGLKDFIFSDRLKYLKDNKGRIFKVFTSEYNDSLITPGIRNEPRFISFNFKEVGEV